MKKLMLSLLISFFAAAVFAQTNADDILGKWKAEDGQAKFEILKVGTSYAVKIIWLSVPNNEKGEPLLDKKNPNNSLRNRSIVGLMITNDLKYAESEKEWQGTMYSPEKGVTANCKIILNNKRELTLKASKYFVTQTKKWSRYE